MSKAALDKADRPSWVAEPPSGELPDPPVAPRPSRLPLAALGWEDFERLCLRLAEVEGQPEHWQIYGTAGQDQGGIDILVRQSGSDKYVVWQSKRYQAMTAHRLKQAVDRFLRDEWAGKTERFILATSADLTATELVKAVETQAKRLRAHGIVFDARDVVKLSTSLKRRPEIVDDFFDRPWTEKFCGLPAARTLDQRLSRGGYDRLRSSLREVYQNHFASVDPGVLRAAAPTAGPTVTLPLVGRYVPHDLLAAAEALGEAWGTQGRADGGESIERESEDDDRRGRGSSRSGLARERPRIPLETWVGDVDKAIVLGPPGAGKSTLLRYLVLDLLSVQPKLERLHERWSGRVPVWVSFPYWTRLIEANAPGADISLEAAAAAWLGAQGQPDLVDLVRQALRSERAVLLVDGVDEWSGETAADTALGLLNTYVTTHRLPAIVTSRPHGGRLLGSLDATWRRFELAGLTRAQQVDFATAWLEHPLPEDPEQAQATRRAARVRAERIVGEIGRSAEIASLAAVPLMLGGLLALTLEGASLPRSRHAAYGELTTRLLESQPRARGKAALAQIHQGGLDPPMRRRILAALAFHIQHHGSPDLGIDAVAVEAAVAFCAARMEESLALAPSEANARARSLIAVGEEALGILVEKSPATVGFLHRAFQEFLAASHISSLNLDDQRDLFRTHGGDPQWRDVLLFSAQAAQRSSEVDALVDAIDAGASGDPALDWSRELLLCEFAFGEANRSAALTRSLAERFFEAVESGPFERQRVDLLRGVIAGLGSEQTAVLVRPRLAAWFPKWTDWNHAQAIPLMAKWSEPEVDGVLWRCMQADRAVEAIASGRALGQRHVDDEPWRSRFSELARNATRATVAAAAVAGLGAGWPAHPETLIVIDRAAASQSRPIAIAGIHERILAGRQDDADRDRLLAWFADDNLAYDSGVPELLALGWRDWDGLREVLLSGQGRWPGDQALETAIRTFPGDDGVAQYLVDRFRARQGFFEFHSHWSVIREHFSGHPLLVEALEERLDEVEDDYAVANGAYVARTPAFKAKLLSRQASRPYLEFWIVDALLDIWPDDPDVREALASLPDWDDDQLSEVAHRLPEVMADTAACRARLISVLESRSGGRRGRADHVLRGLARTGPIADDRRILDAALRLDPDSEYFWAGMNTAIVIEQFKNAPEVIALARRMLHTAQGLTSVIALCQGHLPEMRAAVLKVAAPLPDFLRLTATEALKERAADDDFALNLLEQAQNETEQDVCTAAAIGVADARIARGDIPQTYIGFLDRQLRAIGSRMDGRRYGAIAALGLVRRPDIIQIVRDEANGLSGGHLYRWKDFSQLFAGLARAWPGLQGAFGDETLQSALGLDDDTFLTGLAPYAELDTDLRQAVRAAIERQLAQTLPLPAALDLTARDKVYSHGLLEICLAILDRGGQSWNEVDSVLTAARIIAEDYRDDDHAFRSVVRLSEDLGNFGAVAALCDGWASTAEFEQVFSRIVALHGAAGPLLSMTPMVMKVTLAGSARPQVVEVLRNAANRLTGHIWDGVPHWRPNAVARLQREPAIGDDLLAILQADPTASERLTFASLLSAAYGVTPALRDWGTQQITATGAEPIATTGMDVWHLRSDVSVREHLHDLLRDGA